MLRRSNASDSLVAHRARQTERERSARLANLMANKVGSSGRGIGSGAGQYGVKLVGSLAGKGAEAKGEKLAP